MKNSRVLKIILIVILSLLAIAITSFMIAVINGKLDLSNIRLYSSVSRELVLDEEYDIDFDMIDISSASGDVYIKESSTDEVRVVIYGDKEKTNVNTEESRLSIKLESTPCIGICFTAESKIEIYLPKTYDKSIVIESDYGDIEIGNFTNAEVDINCDSGDVNILSTNSIKIDSNYGDITIGKVNSSDIVASAGDVTIDTIRDAKVKNEYGDIEIGSVLNSLDLTNDCGDITIDNIDLKQNSHIEAALGDIKINDTNEIYIEAKTDLGDIKITNNYRESEVVLNIENDCGDIEINN